MATLTLPQLNTEVFSLKQELSLLKSFLISAIKKDKEGYYKPAFMREIKKAIKEKPEYSFQGKRNFLNQLQTV